MFRNDEEKTRDTELRQEWMRKLFTKFFKDYFPRKELLQHSKRDALLDSPNESAPFVRKPLREVLNFMKQHALRVPQAIKPGWFRIFTRTPEPRSTTPTTEQTYKPDRPGGKGN